MLAIHSLEERKAILAETFAGYDRQDVRGAEFQRLFRVAYEEGLFPELLQSLIPDDAALNEAVYGVVSAWMSRNWWEIQEGAYPELPQLTRELQSVLCTHPDLSNGRP